MPGLTADAQQKLDCDPESWGCCWVEQVSTAFRISHAIEATVLKTALSLVSRPNLCRSKSTSPANPSRH